MDDMKKQSSSTILRSFSLPRKLLCAVMALVMVMTACSDLDVDSAITEVARENGEREAASAIAQAQDAAAADTALQETADADSAATNDTEDASISLDEDGTGTRTDNLPEDPIAMTEDSEATDSDDDEDDAESSEGQLAEDLDPGDFPGEAATVTQGSWTVAENDLGVRVRSVPAGDILGFIQRPDVVQTTGRGRILNNVAWGEVQFENGNRGWMALDLLEASTGRAADNFRDGDGSTSTAVTAAGDGETNGASDDTSTATDPAELTTITVQPQGAFISNRSATLALYTEPDTRSDVVVVAEAGDQIVIINPSGYRNGDIPFVRVSFNGSEGWVDGRFLDVNG